MCRECIMGLVISMCDEHVESVCESVLNAISHDGSFGISVTCYLLYNVPS